jgi:serine protease SohB
MTILWDTLAFAAKAGIVLVTFALCVAVIASAIARARRGGDFDGRLEIKRLNDRFERAAEAMRHALMEPRAFKEHHKRWAKEQKVRAPRDKKVFVLDFKGDVLASAVEHLREEITAVLEVAGKEDEVVVRLESPGGAAHSYGLAASQLGRVRDRGLRLTACVDRVAASGGYMMACVADEIVAAPFSIVGSIGVAAPVPNAHRLLERHGIDYENATAGEYKRTVSFFAKINEEGRKKFQEQLDETHQLFKGFVHSYRPALEIDKVATGEHWHGSRGKELGLVDRLATSDDFLRERAEKADLIQVRYRPRLELRDRLAVAASTVAERVLTSLWSRFGTSML